jgi:GMP synthase-like glutamine amidotransferase
MGQMEDILNGEVDCYIRKKKDGKTFEARDHIGLILMGSNRSVKKRTRKRELGWIDTAMNSTIPILGICDGAQLIALYLNGIEAIELEQRDEGLSQLKIKGDGVPDAQADDDDIIQPALSVLMCQDHGWRYTLPDGCVNLANSQDMKHSDAFRLPGRLVYGLQFHPELTAVDIKWLDPRASLPDCEKVELAGKEILEEFIQQARKANG